MNNVLFNDFKKIVLDNRPLLDLRAEVEFAKGSFPNAVNIPILNNKEREKIGIHYKKYGNESATELGYKMISGEIKEVRVKAWAKFISSNDNALLYCFRGGSRSRIAQDWLRDIGIKVPRIDGGYKAFRNFLLNEITENFDPNIHPITLAGKTGAGKTIVINKIKNSIDLEMLAMHRGSSFGNKIQNQPKQINFENKLAYELIHFKQKGLKHIVFEDESKNIGSIFMKENFLNWIRSKYIVMIDSSLDERVQNTFNEYVINSQNEYIKFYGDNGLEKWYSYIKQSMERLEKRLGLEKLKLFFSKFQYAHDYQINTGDPKMHKAWIRLFLTDYYDPMYNYQMKKSNRELIFKGDLNSCVDFLNNLS